MLIDVWFIVSRGGYVIICLSCLLHAFRAR